MRKTIRKKAIFFTLDGILAAALLLLVVAIIPRFLASQSSVTPTTLMAHDSTNVLAEMRVYEVDSEEMQEMIENGSITSPNQSVLEQIGEFWSKNDTNNAKNISREALGSTIKNYELYVNNDLIDARGTASETLVSSKRMVSGITKGRAKSGFNARAIATKTEKTTTSILRFHPEGSGNEGGQGVEITKKFNLSTANITSAKLYISIHYGVSDIQSMKFYLNGQDLGITKFDWLYIEDSNLTDKTHVAFTLANVTDKIKTGNNTILYSLKSQTSGHAHLHPGGRLEVVHTSTKQYDANETISEKIFFDNIKSIETGQKRSGAWAVMPINIPAGVTIKNATFHLHAKDIEPYSPQDVINRGKGNCSTINANNSHNVRIYLGNDTIALINDSTDINNEVINKNYDLTLKLKQNTNVLAVYLNMYADCFWGEGDTILYSEPIEDPSGSTYIDLEYTRVPLELEYGKIDVNVVELFNTTKSNDVTANKFVNGTVLHSFIELATLENQNVSAWSNGNFIFQTPRALATPSTLFIDNSYVISPGTNTLRVKDCIHCKIIPESAYSYLILIPNQVPYGETFDTEEEAREDAVNRLKNTLGKHVNALEIQNQTVSISNVPSLWGPALVEVRIWQ